MNRRTSSLLFFSPIVGAAILLALHALLPLAENGAAALLLETGANLFCTLAALLLCLRTGIRLIPPKGARPAFPSPCPPIFLICTVLCLLVAINNLPFLSLFTARARITAGVGRILLFALSCLSTAAFEELFFRGLLFSLCLRRWRIFPAVLLSSTAFGVAHLFNLAAGASLPETLLQVGYSFLIGAAAAMLFLFSRSILLPILFHAIYNFGGLLVMRLGEGQIFDTPTVIFTAILATFCALSLFFSLFSPALKEVKKQFRDINPIKTP